MRISDWSSDVCSSDLSTDPKLLCASFRPLRRCRIGLPKDRNCGRSSRRNIDALRSHIFQHALHSIFDAKATLLVSGEGRVGAEEEILIDPDRSEEHTSELKSLMRISYAVFCLTKKKY